MAIPRRDEFDFLFNDGRGIRTNQLSGVLEDTQIPASIMRDAEFTAVAVRGLLGLTAQEVNNLLTGATISGQVLNFPQNDGTSIPITIPTAIAGTGDGVVQSGAFADDGETLVLTLDNGGTVEIDVPELLRQMANTLDQTARDSAAAAQAAADAHALTQHNRDDTARANAVAAQAAADGAQTEITTHGQSIHNTDQIARDGVDTAQQAANAAGAAAMNANAAAVTAGQTATDAETDAAAAEQRILNHEANHPGSTITAVFSPNANGTFPAVTQAMYDDGAVLVSPRTLRVPFRYPDGGTTRNMATWNTYAPANFYTVLQYSDFPIDAPNGARGYTTYNHGFWMKEAGFWQTNAPPPGTTYLGDFLSNGDANDAVTGNNQLAYFSRILHVSSNYVAGGDVTYAYGWTADAPAPHRLIETEITDPDSEVFGEISGEILRALVYTFEGHGRPLNHPAFIGQRAVNQGGREWVGGFEFVDHSTASSWTSANVADVVWSRWLGVSTTGMSGLFSIIGSFEFRTNRNRFHQLDQNGNTVDRTWAELVDWFRANQTHIGNVPAGLIPLTGERSVFLSGPHISFATDAEAAAFIAAEQLSDTATKAFAWFVGDSSDVTDWTLRWATAGAYVAGVTNITEELRWLGPLAIDAGGTGGEVTVTPSAGRFSRSSLAVRNTSAARIGRIVRHITLSTALADIDNDDDIEIILESTSTNRVISPQIRFQAKLLKDLVVSTLADATTFTSPFPSYVAGDALKYLEFKVTRGDSGSVQGFAHDTIVVGRFGAGTTENPDKIIMWAANTAVGWAHYWVNRVQYGVAETGGQQLGDGSVGGYYFGAFYQQAASAPSFNGVPDNDGAWSGLGDWHANRGDAIDATSTNPVWIAYASGYINSSDVVFVSTPQVFAEFSTQYSNDGFSTITNAAPVDPDGWWRRDILPGGGFTAPIPLFHTDNPWIPVWAEEPFYTTNDDGVSQDFNLNLSNVTAIRFTLTAFGLWSDDGIPQRPGAICTDVMPRPPVGWSTTDFNDDNRATTGLYSVYYHESAGLQVHHQNDGSAADFNIPVGSYRDTDYPARAWACALKMIASNTNEHLQLTALRIFDASQPYERFLWTIEVQRET